jgi:hypothetical protein
MECGENRRFGFFFGFCTVFEKKSKAAILAALHSAATCILILPIKCSAISAFSAVNPPNLRHGFKRIVAQGMASRPA